MKSEDFLYSNPIATVRTVSTTYSNFFLIILEFFNNIQLYLIIYINKLMEIIILHKEKNNKIYNKYMSKQKFSVK